MEKNIRVVVRVRPFSTREMEQNQRNLIQVIDQKTLVFDPDQEYDEFFFQGVKQNYRDITKRVHKKLSMEFDDVFDADASNADVFESCMKPLITSIMDGYNCSVFVYGATGAGKTHTMLGNNTCRGITFLTIKELFDQIDNLRENRNFKIGMSYLEVYNEQVMNLLTKTGPLKLREDVNGVVVGGLKLNEIHNADELFDLLIIGNKNRTQHPTDANSESSRSHAIFQVHIHMTDKITQQKRTVKLSMIDLAGSERAASTKGMGLRFKEGASINKSLLALGNCINNLADGLKHIPYRDSNLTRILKDSLGGNCQTIMIANVSPSSLTYEDTYNTLKYASRAKNIRTTLKQNILKANMPKDYYVKKVNEQQNDMQKLRNTIKSLESKLLGIQQNPAPATTVSGLNNNKKIKLISNVQQESNSGFSVDLDELEEWYRKIDDAYLTATNIQQKFLILQSKANILKCRISLKEKAGRTTKDLVLDGTHTTVETNKIEASIDKYGKDQHRTEEDQKRWKKRFIDANDELDKLKAEAKQDKYSRFLLIYIESKENDMKLKASIETQNHMIKVSYIKDADAQNIENVLPTCCEIIQNQYLLLRCNALLDSASIEKVEKLKKLLQGQRAVKFDDEINANDYDMEYLKLSSHTLFENNENKISEEKSAKRVFVFGDEEIETYPKKKPKMQLFADNRLTDFIKSKGILNLKNEIISSDVNQPNELQNCGGLNETVILSKHDNGIEIDGIKRIANDQLINNININAVDKKKRILGDKNINNKGAKPVLKVTPRTPKTKLILAGVAKENKKFSPIRSKRSPRPATNSRMALAQKAFKIAHHRSKSGGPSSSGDLATESAKKARFYPLIKKSS